MFASMLNNPILIIAAVEFSVATLLLVVGLLLFVRSQRRTLGALEEKIVELRSALKQTRAELKAAKQRPANVVQSPVDFSAMIEEQINITRNHHLSLNPDRDIVLDIAPDTPSDRRAVSLRHAFLIAEKEAWAAADGKEVDWDVLSGKLGQIIDFYEQPAVLPAVEEVPDVGSDMFDALELEPEAPLEELMVEEVAAPPASAADAEELERLQELIANQKRHIENLERFKALFFATDEKWRAASEQAEEYHQQLLQRSAEMGADAEYQQLLEKYGRVYDEIDASLAAERGEEPRTPPSAPSIEVDADEPTVGRMVIANQEEIQRLRNMAVDQHKMIMHLREELNAAQSDEEKERVIAELHKQLERHERFLKESDICTKQLESELDRTLEENHALKIKLQDARIQARSEPAVQNADVEQMVKIIEDFTEQSSEMLNTIEVLEKESRDLQEKLAQVDSANAGGGDTAAVREELAQAQKELLELQSQHLELEERYLELKMKSI